jgi:glycosyltransferase involved in cell wall biosynthesis
LTGAKVKTPYIIRTGVDIQTILSDTVSYEKEELIEKKYVFFPRAMRSLYNHELAIDAIAILPETIIKEFSFVFVDKNSADKAYTSLIEDKIKQSAANFIWFENLGQKTLFQTYKNASLCIMTPKSDGTPVSAVEAMLCRVPLILPPLEYDPDLFSEGVMFFNERTAESLSSLIEAVLCGQKLPDIEMAYKNALHLADRNKEMNKLGMIYKELNARK